MKLLHHSTLGIARHLAVTLSMLPSLQAEVSTMVSAEQITFCVPEAHLPPPLKPDEWSLAAMQRLVAAGKATIASKAFTTNKSGNPYNQASAVREFTYVTDYDLVRGKKVPTTWSIRNTGTDFTISPRMSRNLAGEMEMIYLPLSNENVEFARFLDWNGPSLWPAPKADQGPIFQPVFRNQKLKTEPQIASGEPQLLGVMHMHAALNQVLRSDELPADIAYVSFLRAQPPSGQTAKAGPTPVNLYLECVAVSLPASDALALLAVDADHAALWDRVSVSLGSGNAHLLVHESVLSGPNASASHGQILEFPYPTDFEEGEGTTYNTLNCGNEMNCNWHRLDSGLSEVELKLRMIPTPTLVSWPPGGNATSVLPSFTKLEFQTTFPIQDQAIHFLGAILPTAAISQAPFSSKEMILIFARGNLSHNAISAPSTAPASYLAAFSIPPNIATELQSLPTSGNPMEIISALLTQASTRLLAFTTITPKTALQCACEESYPTNLDPKTGENSGWDLINIGMKFDHLAESTSCQLAYHLKPLPAKTLALSKQLEGNKSGWEQLADPHKFTIPNTDLPPPGNFTVLKLQPNTQEPGSEKKEAWELVVLGTLPSK